MNNERAKVKEIPGFERDPTTRAIINTDRNAYENHMRTKNRNRQKDLEIAKLKSDILELKGLVKTLVDKIDG
tara:strand:+ start:3361 stop:3576 length:216 start_codon:yes stop_codon:yes gene_type:complete